MQKKYSFQYHNAKTKQHIQTVQVQRDDEESARIQADSIIRMFRNKLNELAVTVELVS